MYEVVRINNSQLSPGMEDADLMFDELSTPGASSLDSSLYSSDYPFTTSGDEEWVDFHPQSDLSIPPKVNSPTEIQSEHALNQNSHSRRSQWETSVRRPDDCLAHYYDNTADSFSTFMNASPTTRHVIENFKNILESNGFTMINERKINHVTSAPGKFYIIRNGQALVAFVVGRKWSPSQGSCFIGCHVDALTIKINPAHSLIPQTKDGYQLLGVAPYSGALSNQWLNRDLGIAGSVIVQNRDKVKRILISSGAKAIATIPKLAEHFNLERPYNLQTEMVPIIAHSACGNIPEATDEEKKCLIYGEHLLSLIRYVTKLAKVNVGDIIGLDLELVDVQPTVRGGLSNEFIVSGALDDRLCSFDAINGLIEFSSNFSDARTLDEYDGFSGVYLADNEEIGSNTRTGAGGGLLQDTMRSVVSSRYDATPERMARLFSESVIISSDVTHALNPNFKSIYLNRNFPLPNTGPSIKFDSNGHVLSDTISEIFARNIVEKHLPDMKLQHFHIRNDSRSGSTIGPILSGKRGVPGAKMIIDIGMPILSMHSIRGMTGYKDVGMGIRFFREVLTHWKNASTEVNLDPEQTSSTCDRPV